jgi:hypothetical protein
MHRAADQVLAVHQGAIDVEDDEFHGPIIGSNIRDQTARQSFIQEIPLECMQCHGSRALCNATNRAKACGLPSFDLILFLSLNRGRLDSGLDSRGEDRT